MSDNYNTLLLAAAAVIIIRRRRRRRAALVGRVWSRNWLLMRTSDREMQNFVMNELMVPDAGVFRSFLRMTPN